MMDEEARAAGAAEACGAEQGEKYDCKSIQKQEALSGLDGIGGAGAHSLTSLSVFLSPTRSSVL
jgi:hypothetical protein